MPVVVDTSPLIALWRIGLIHLLPDMFGAISCPESVKMEIDAGAAKYGSILLGSYEWLTIEPDPPMMQLRKELGAGETAAITLAYQINAGLIILDDLAARLVAQELGLRVTGTIGILFAAKEKRLITDVNIHFKALQDAGFHLPSHIVARV